MKILELSELPERVQPQLAALSWLDGDYPQDYLFLRHLRGLGYPVSDYEGLFAVEAGQLLGKVETVVLPFATPHGTEPVLGVSTVATRPDAVGRGVATALLREAHAREQKTGRRWAFLWTHRSWGAHRLYERLGYRDVYSPPAALRRIPRSAGRSLPAGYDWSILQEADGSVLERLLHTSTRRRYGFVPRFHGSFRIRFLMRWRSPSEHGLLYRRGVPVGYAYTTSNPEAVGAYEVVVRNARDASPLLDALERRAAGRWLVFGHTTFVNDHAALLRDRGYAVYGRSHTTLMARRLHADAGRTRRVSAATVCRDPGFSCHRGDLF